MIFVQKFNFDKTPTFSRVFHPNFFWQFFSWNQSCQQLNSSKPQHFHKFFTPKNRQFLDKKWRFRTVCVNWNEFELIFVDAVTLSLFWLPKYRCIIHRYVSPDFLLPLQLPTNISHHEQDYFLAFCRYSTASQRTGLFLANWTKTRIKGKRGIQLFPVDFQSRFVFTSFFKHKYTLVVR